MLNILHRATLHTPHSRGQQLTYAGITSCSSSHRERKAAQTYLPLSASVLYGEILALCKWQCLCLSLQGWGDRLNKSSHVYYKIDLPFIRKHHSSFVVTQIFWFHSFQMIGDMPNGAEKQVSCRCCTRWNHSKVTVYLLRVTIRLKNKWTYCH